MNNERDALNRRCARNPEPGDYWQEMLMPICVVLAVTGDKVDLCKTIKQTRGGTAWTWDLAQRQEMTRAEFDEWLSYDSIDGYWADVSPQAHEWVTEWKEIVEL
jgi:hypothetical protein